MCLARHGGHSQVEILEVGPRPLDLGLGDREEAGTGLNLGLLPRHGDESWLTCHSNCHYTVGLSLGVHITSQVYIWQNHVSQNIPFWFDRREKTVLNQLTVFHLQTFESDN